MRYILGVFHFIIADKCSLYRSKGGDKILQIPLRISFRLSVVRAQQNHCVSGRGRFGGLQVFCIVSS